jgi:hypothetical protein
MANDDLLQKVRYSCINIMKIALCNDICEFAQNKLANRDWGRRFPGTGWATHLYEQGARLGIEVASGDMAIAHIRSGRWRSSEVHVVQELDARDGQELCRLGARPALLTLFESPMVAFRSMDRLSRSRVPFENCLGPRILFERMAAQRHSQLWPMTFPSVWSSEIRSEMSLRGGRPVVLVAANKHVRELSGPGCKGRIRHLKRSIRRRLSATFRTFGRSQLHDARLQVLLAFAARQAIEVFGTGWDHLERVPLQWQNQLRSHSDIFRGPCQDKCEVMSLYRMAIVFENVACPGYVTEKVVDAIAAGCVPIYRGAPDISEHVPGAAILEIGSKETAIETVDRALGLTEEQHAALIAEGSRFLATPRGRRHTHEGFAEWVVDLLRGRSA